jgi:hypothetical protein
VVNSTLARQCIRLRSRRPYDVPRPCLLLAVCKRPLRAVTKVVPAWVIVEILSASERIGDERAVL